MKLKKTGKSTSAEVSHISKHGIWMLIENSEYFLPFKEYPWFKEAKIKEIHNFELVHNKHLHWPDLDIDLGLDTLKNAEKFPLKAKVINSSSKKN